jgi:hypothetical protein
MALTTLKLKPIEEIVLMFLREKFTNLLID